ALNRLWPTPADPWLFWLYAEMLNAWGEVDYADDVLSPLVFTGGLNNPEARTHRLALRDEAALKRADRKQAEEGVRPPPEKADPDPEPAAAPPPRPWLPDWRPLAVGFGVGAPVTPPVRAPVRQWARRPAAPPPPPQP